MGTWFVLCDNSSLLCYLFRFFTIMSYGNNGRGRGYYHGSGHMNQDRRFQSPSTPRNHNPRQRFSSPFFSPNQSYHSIPSNYSTPQSSNISYNSSAYNTPIHYNSPPPFNRNFASPHQHRHRSPFTPPRYRGNSNRSFNSPREPRNHGGGRDAYYKESMTEDPWKDMPVVYIKN